MRFDIFKHTKTKRKKFIEEITNLCIFPSTTYSILICSLIFRNKGQNDSKYKTHQTINTMPPHSIQLKHLLS